jgi:hypothetical protein
MRLSPSPTDSGAAPAPSTSATPTPGTSTIVSNDGTGVTTVEITNPFTPSEIADQYVYYEMTFTCTGDGSFHVEATPPTGSFVGGDHCADGSATGSGYAMLLGPGATPVFKVKVDVDDATTWNLAGTLQARPR